MGDPLPMTRRRYLTIKGCQAIIEGQQIGSALLVVEAVASTALEHPEWDMDEERTWDEWEAVTSDE